MPKFHLAVAPFLLVLLLNHALYAQSYTATPLPGPLHRISANGINDSGMVVGSSGVAKSDALLWSPNGSYQVLGTLGGKYAYAYAINNLGQVVGYSTLPGDSTFHAFLWTQSGGMQDLGSLGAGYSEANAINDNSEVVGTSCLDLYDSVCHAFLWTQAGGMQDLGTLGGPNSAARGINSAGYVTGEAQLADSTQHAFLWTAQTGMQELVPGETVSSEAEAINDSDQVVGSFTNEQANQTDAFLWTQATGMQDLGTLGGGYSIAYAINNAGAVVGWAVTAKGSPFSVIWPPGGPIEKLGPLVVPKKIPLPNGATGINSSGQIAADGIHLPYLLTPATKAKPSSKNASSMSNR